MNARIVGGSAATCLGKPNERSTGEACRKAGKNERMVNRCSCDTTSIFVGCMKYQCPSSCARTASTSFGWLSLISVSKMTMCLLWRSSIVVSTRGQTQHGGSTHPGEPEEVRVAVGAALRAVDLVEVLQRELEFRGESLDACAQFALGEGRQFVEQRLDDGRVQDDHGELESDAVGRYQKYVRGSYKKQALRTGRP